MTHKHSQSGCIFIYTNFYESIFFEKINSILNKIIIKYIKDNSQIEKVHCEETQNRVTKQYNNK